jgi:hypothetical protein
VAAAQALLRNLTNLELDWAHAGLSAIEGADSFLQKGTLWLAFLGASLATHEDKQIAIDILPRIAPPRLRALMKGFVGLAAGATAMALSGVFYLAVLNNAQDRPLEYEVFSAAGQAIHVCDATAAELSEAGLERPSLFCAVRSTLGVLGAPVETPGAAAQLIVPVMFFVIGVRLLFKGAGGFLSLSSPTGDVPPSPGLERVAEEESRTGDDR